MIFVRFPRLEVEAIGIAFATLNPAGHKNLQIGGCCMSLERMISVGLLGWLVVGFLLMGLNVW